MELLDSNSIYFILRDLGGWAVVVYIVYWLTRRWEAQMDKMILAFQEGQTKVAESIQSLEASTNKRIDAIDRKLDSRLTLDQLARQVSDGRL